MDIAAAAPATPCGRLIVPTPSAAAALDSRGAAITASVKRPQLGRAFPGPPRFTAWSGFTAVTFEGRRCACNETVDRLCPMARES